jgi:hypothetical protein
VLRTLALLLLLANLGLWAYTQGHLAPLGLAPFEAREPERLAQQVAPQTLRVLNAPVPAPASAFAEPAAAAPALPVPAQAAAARLGPLAAEATPAAASAPAPRLETEPAAPTPAAAPEAPRPGLATATAPPGTGPGPATACWQARGLSGPQAALVRAALEPKADLQGRWNLAETRLPPRWLVYIGPMASERALQQRRAELTLAEIEHRSVAAPLAPGLALGTFSSRERAEVALAQARREGVRDARVLQERPETISHTLVLSAVSAAQLRQIEAMAILPPRVLQACP